MYFRINVHRLELIHNFYLHMLKKYVLLKLFKKLVALIWVAVVAFVQGQEVNEQVTAARNNA